MYVLHETTPNWKCGAILVILSHDHVLIDRVIVLMNELSVLAILSVKNSIREVRRLWCAGLEVIDNQPLPIAKMTIRTVAVYSYGPRASHHLEGWRQKWIFVVMKENFLCYGVVIGELIRDLWLHCSRALRKSLLRFGRSTFAISFVRL